MKSALALIALTLTAATSVYVALDVAPIAAPDAPQPLAAAPATGVSTLFASGGQLVAPTALAGTAPVANSESTETVQVSGKNRGLVLADNDDDGLLKRPFARADDEDHNGEDDDEDGGAGCPRGATNCAQNANPASAGQTAPPANGLFTPGAKPSAQTN